MSIELIPATDPQAYNDVVAAMPLSSPLQGWGYGEARRVLGQTPERYLLRRSGETVGAVQLIRKRLLPGFSTLYAPRGPALLNTDLLPEFGQARSGDDGVEHAVHVRWGLAVADEQQSHAATLRTAADVSPAGCSSGGSSC